MEDHLKSPSHHLSGAHDGQHFNSYDQVRETHLHFSTKIKKVLKQNKRKDSAMVSNLKRMKIFSPKHYSTKCARKMSVKPKCAQNKSASIKFSPVFLGFETSKTSKQLGNHEKETTSLSPKICDLSPAMRVSDMIKTNCNKPQRRKISKRKNTIFSPHSRSIGKSTKSSTLYEQNISIFKNESKVNEIQKLKEENLDLRQQIKTMKDRIFTKEQEWKRQEELLTNDKSNYHKGVKHQISLKFKAQINDLRRKNRDDLETFTSQLRQAEKEFKEKYERMETHYIMKINSLYSMVEEKNDTIADLESKIEDLEASMNDLKENKGDNYTLVTINNALRINLKNSKKEIEGYKQRIKELTKSLQYSES
ncbi:unnamed protein product [Moneuplotes crassus]|uniref:Uncharacterized protein n=1 Tax=Euplotes crassus TaxID=5936 RepID=A0AAD2D6D5_EUPCR|nr:unnamed protein product [Moneuplotes crassus]